MQYKNRLMVTILMGFAALQMAGCGGAKPAEASKVPPVEIVKPADTAGFNQVILTERAAQRIIIETGAVEEKQINGAKRLVVPYSSVIYGLKGETWVYVNPEPLKFMRQVIVIDTIKDGVAVLKEGPAAGTSVATVGVAELYGADTGVGK